MGLKSLPKLLLIYSIAVLVFLIIIASNVDVEVKRLRRDDQASDQALTRSLIATDELENDQKHATEATPVTETAGTIPPLHKCSMVHLAFVVDDLRSLITQALKSVLMSRRCPLHVHFIADSFNQSVVQTLMETWQLPYVEFSLYSTDYIQRNFSIDASVRSTDVLDMSVLLLPYILPQSLDNVLVFDSNVLVVGDVRELWSLALELNQQNKLFAVSKSSSIQGYFDPGILILSLKSMRESNWNQLWQKAAGNTPQSRYTTRDVFNSVIMTYPDAMSILPCIWNINGINQLTCSTNTSDYRLIHLDGTESESNDVYSKYMSELETLVRAKESPDLRILPSLCDKEVDPQKDQRKLRLPMLPRRSRREMCRLISHEKDRVFVTHKYFYGSPYVPVENFETTLVTQLSLDRLDKFRLLLSHWDGPVSISMYGTDAQAWNLTKFMENEGLGSRTNLIVHVVYKQGRFYPVNHLRNMALDSVTTPYVFLIDGDFLPSYGLFQYLKRANKVLMTGDRKRALIVPAFNGEEGFIYPSSKDDLQDQLSKGSVKMFCVWCAHQTHGQTNYTVWTSATRPYKVEWAFHFEPYVVVDRDVPRYDDRFVGYGWNKVSQITELKAQGYEFVVLPDVFIIHSPHPRTTDREIWKRKNYKFCINSLWKRFIQDLLLKYGPDCLKENKLVPVMLDVTI